MVGIGVGVVVGVAVGVLVGVAVLVGTVVAVGNNVALGADVGVGADAGAQADTIRLTSNNTSTVRFILRVLLWRSSRPTTRASAAAKRAQRAKRSAESACWAGFYHGPHSFCMANWTLHTEICSKSKLFMPLGRENR
jgi:hypothetical protein